MRNRERWGIAIVVEAVTIGYKPAINGILRDSCGRAAGLFGL
jgi:hypothetical protein